MLSNYSETITIELSVDKGLVWSKLNATQDDTFSLITLIPEPTP